jgi:hypothetical protein
MNNNIISNWNVLTKEQQEQALKLLENTSVDNNSIINISSATAAKDFFNKNHWVKIESFIDKNMANFLYNYVILETARLNYIEETQGKGNYDIDFWGEFDDFQALGDFSKYGDLTFDTLLNQSLNKMELIVGKKLIPTYSYHRLYTTDTELVRHKDRRSCEISTTLCLGYDNSNVDNKKYPDWNWPMFVGPGTGEEGTEGIPIHMKPGDMLVYRGCEIEHWREPFWGINHAQVFLHYNEKDGKYNNLYDGRPLLGLGTKYKSNIVI